MAFTTVAEEIEAPVEETPAWLDEPQPAGWKQRVRDLLVAIFKGHEEFLGWTPD